MEYIIPSNNALDPNKETIYVTSNIQEDVIWYCRYNYVLMNEIYVKNSSTLRIEAGTIIYANSVELSNESSIPAIIVEKDSKIISNGTKEKPIIFTSIIPLEVIFEVNPYTNKYVYSEGLGPFGEYWNGITISGTGLTNSLTENNDKLGSYYIPYGGSNEESYNFELTYTNIYFAGINRFESNSLTIGAPSYEDKLCNCEILFGQTSCLVIYGGSLMVNNNIMGFTYSIGCIGITNGAQIYFSKNFFIEGLDNIDEEYLSTDSLNSFIIASTILNEGDQLNRRSIVFSNNNTFLSLTYTANYITLIDEARIYTLNNLYIGTCINVFNLLNVTNQTGGILTISNNLPLTYTDNYIYLGPCTYSHINGVYYAGPQIDINIPNESAQTLRHIEFLFYGIDQHKLIEGKFLDVIPNIVSDVYHNSTSNNDYFNNHLVPLISYIYWNNLPDTDKYNRFKVPSYACGVIQNELDLKNWNFGFFSHLVRFFHYCPYYTPSYWCPILNKNPVSSNYEYIDSNQNEHYVDNYKNVNNHHNNHNYKNNNNNNKCVKEICVKDDSSSSSSESECIIKKRLKKVHKKSKKYESSSESSSESECEEVKRKKKSKKVHKKSKKYESSSESSSESECEEIKKKSKSKSKSKKESSSESDSEDEKKKNKKKSTKKYLSSDSETECENTYIHKKKSSKKNKNNKSLFEKVDKNTLNNGLLLSNMVLMGLSSFLSDSD